MKRVPHSEVETLKAIYRKWKDQEGVNAEADVAKSVLLRKLGVFGVTVEEFYEKIKGPTFHHYSYGYGNPFEAMRRQKEYEQRQQAERAEADRKKRQEEADAAFARRQAAGVTTVEMRFTCRTKWEQDIAVELVFKYGQMGQGKRPAANRVASTIIGIKVPHDKTDIITRKWKAAKQAWADALEKAATQFRNNL